LTRDDPAGDRPRLRLRLQPDDLAARRIGHGAAGTDGLALVSDTASIAVMELVDNAILLVIPGAMAASVATPLFWASLAASLAIAWVVTFPVNRWLIARGRGHAVVHGAH
jgi:uncharacterized RDD family membrane protein YckC